MTRDLEHMTASEMDQLAPRLVNISRMIEALYNGEVFSDDSNTWEALYEAAEDMDAWTEAAGIQDKRLIDIDFHVTVAYDQNANGETSYEELEKAYLACEIALDTEPAEQPRTWKVGDEEYTQADLLLCLNLAIELIKDMDKNVEFLPFAIRKVECLNDNFSIAGFRRTVEDLDLIRRKLS